MKISKQELINRILERCPEEVEVLITPRPNFIEDIKIYGLAVPRSEIDLKLIDYLSKNATVTITGLTKRFETTIEKVTSILTELGFSPRYELTCTALKPEMGELGCDSILCRFHDVNTVFQLLVDLSHVEAKHCKDLLNKAEQIGDFSWFLECPNCYSLRVIDLENLPAPKIWSKEVREEIHPYFGKTLFNKYKK